MRRWRTACTYEANLSGAKCGRRLAGVASSGTGVTSPKTPRLYERSSSRGGPGASPGGAWSRRDDNGCGRREPAGRNARHPWGAAGGGGRLAVAALRRARMPEDSSLGGAEGSRESGEKESVTCRPGVAPWSVRFIPPVRPRVSGAPISADEPGSTLWPIGRVVCYARIGCCHASNKKAPQSVRG